MVDTTFPVRRPQPRSQSKKPIFSPEAIQIKETLGLILESYNRLGGKDLKSILKSYKQFYIDFIQTEKRASYQYKIHSSNNRQSDLWKIIKTETSQSNKSQPFPPQEDLNNFFVSVSNQSPTILPCDHPAHSKPVNFFLNPIAPTEILCIIQNLKPKSTPDIYYLNTQLVKWSASYIAEPLTDIFNACYEQAQVPDRMKVAKIKPIFKKDDPTDCSNYRPIAVLPVFSKVFESALLSRFLDFLRAQQILNDSQFGFRSGRSTVDAVRSLMNFVWEAMQGGEETRAVMCDLSKAFDTIHHDRLLERMENYGIRGMPLQLFRSYLHNRQQAAYCDGDLSSFQPVRGGIAQGSLMGPALFCLFINDLPEHVSGRVVLFADDTTLLTRDSNPDLLDSKSDKMLADAKKWFDTNGLKLNEDKTAKLNFTSKRNIPCIEKSSAKLLGITIDTRTTWAPHIEDLVTTLSRAIYAIRRVRQIVVLCYHALFHSRLSYGLELWGGSAHVERIFVQQKRAVRAVVQAGWTTHCKPLFKRLKVMTLPSMYTLQLLLRARREMIDLPTREDCATRKLRNAGHLNIPFHRIDTTAIQHKHLRLFNCWSDDWRAKPYKRFKLDLQKALSQEACYDMKEIINLIKYGME